MSAREKGGWDKMNYKAFQIILIILMFVSFVGGFYYVDSFNWEDDFGDSSYNQSLWTNYSGCVNGPGGTCSHQNQENSGYIRLFATGNDLGAGNSFNAWAVTRTETNLNNGGDFRIDFELNNTLGGLESEDVVGIDISNGTTISNLNQADGKTLINHITSSTQTASNYTIIIYGDTNNATLYNISRDVIASVILQDQANWFIQFRASVEGNSGGETGEINIFNFTHQEWGIILGSPEDEKLTSDLSQIFNASINFYDDSLTNATLFIWHQNGTLFNRTTNSLTGSESNESSWNISFVNPGVYIWNVEGCSQNDCKMASNNRTFSFGITINSETFSATAFDTQTEIYSINISIIEDIISSSAVLVYNGSNYLSTKSISGDNSIFQSSIPIGAVNSEQNNSFFWKISLTDSSGQIIFNTTINNQTVSPSNFSQCSAGAMPSINYTIYDEDTLSQIAADFDSIFEWKLNLSSAVEKNSSWGLSGSSNYNFCVNTNKTFYVDANIILSSSGYTDRTFRFSSEEYNNITTNQSLYLLNSSNSREVILVVKDVGLRPLSDYTIKVYRTVASTNKQILVESDKTDEFGQIVASLVENDVKYKIEFYDEDNTLVKTVNSAIVACRSTICVQEFIVEDTSNPFSIYDNIDNYDSTLTFNNNTNTFSFVWVDNTGIASSHRLEVKRIAFNGTTIVCNSTSSLTSGVLSCAVGDSRATYNAAGYRTASPEARKQLLGIKVGSAYQTFGTEGLFWAFILLTTLIVGGIYNPPIGIVLYLMGVIFLGIFDIILINPAIIFAQLAIGGLFIWFFRG